MPRTAQFDRNDIVSRAQSLFWQRGWAGTSMKDIERVLGIRPGSFYAAFGSKEALYAETLDLYAERGTARLRALADDLGPIGALKAYVLGFADRENSDRAKACMLVKTLLEVQGLQEALSDKAHSLLDQMEKQFEALFVAAQDANEIAAHYDPASLARRYQSDLIGLRASLERKSVDVEALAQEIAGELDQLV
ncbi:TetR/AcrR family transcriptional regulator [Cognatishimia activa]|uniref:TetR/AcrR family transcriptional regulator n=1 Tax=Cognatishimia activa TaxID=1715691 RepID=UPI00222E1F3D|nr:TetR/AcrR family transcriptional regulator [Cognatishimia activa]UZD90379.1 TetR/AcrR family transcriptional regulator [Cognatishimia activa]